MPLSAGRRRTIRRSAVIGIAVLLAGCAAVLIALSLPAVRTALLRTAIMRAARTLPGELTLRRMEWPAWSVLQCEDLLWRIEGDTLISAAQLSVDVALAPLWRRDLDVRRCEVTGLTLDLMRMEASRDAPDSTARDRGGFLRTGALPGLPSVAIHHCRLELAHLRASSQLQLDQTTLEGGVDLLHGNPPGLRITRAEAHAAGEDWALDHLELVLDLERGEVAGAGHGRLAAGWPLRFSLGAVGRDSLRVELFYASDAGEIDQRTLDLIVGLDREDWHLHAARFRAEIETPGVAELEYFPRIGPRLAACPRLTGLAGTIAGQAELGSSRRIAARFDFGRTRWLEDLHGRLEISEQGMALDSLALQLADLTLNGRAMVNSDSLRADAALMMRGTEWLMRLQPERELPIDQIAVDVRAHASGPHRAPALGVDLEAALTFQGHAHHLAWHGRARLGETIEAELEPLVIQRGDHAPLHPVASPGRLRFNARERSLRIADLRVVGDYGEGRASLQWPSGDFALECTWPQPPAGLRIDAPAWERDGPYRVDLTGHLDLRGVKPIITARGDLILPGPRTFNAELRDLGPVRGDLRIAGERSIYRAELDLTRTAWIDSAAVRLRLLPESLHADTVFVHLPDLHVAGRGTRRDGQWDGEISLVMPGAAWVRRLGFVIELDLALEATARFAGSQVEGDFEGHATWPGYVVPQVRGRLRSTDGGGTITLSAPAGVTTPLFALDDLHATYTPEGSLPKLLPGHGRLRARGRDFDLQHAGRIARTPDWTLRSDSLRLMLGDRDLANQEPFLIEIGAEQSGIAIRDLVLEGSLGELRADGFVAPDSAALTARAHLELPARPPLQVPDELWPRSGDLELRVTSPQDMVLDLQVAGLRIVSGEAIGVDLALETGAGSLDGRGSVQDSLGPILMANVQVPARIRIHPFSVQWEPGPLTVDLRTERFPLPVGRTEYPPLRFAGECLVRGTREHPAGYLAGRVTFLGWPKIDRHEVDLAAAIVSPADGIAPLDQRIAANDLLRPVGSAPRNVSAAIAGWRFRRGAGVLAHGHLFCPVTFAEKGWGIRASGEDSLRLVCAAQGLPLEELDPFLPREVAFKGPCDFALEAAGAAQDPVLKGYVRMPAFTLSHAEGSRLTGRTEISLGGRRTHPSLSGEIELSRGVLRIPDSPKQLHPVNGSALLWELYGGAETTGDSSAAVAEEASAAGSTLDLDVALDIPGGLWIRGRGLEVELAGNLQVQQEEYYPVINGELRAVQGHLAMLGHLFRVVRGRVVFYGDLAVNPTLDLLLQASVEGHLIDVQFVGTLQKPEMTLQSQPEMAEGDIIAFLLFGRRLDELDNDQVNLLQRRAADLAASYGTAQLEARLSHQLGVDMVTVKRGNDGNALIIGKYLSRRALLRYEQTLENDLQLYLNLEYFLGRSLKLETLIGSNNQSGIGLSWEREY